jgi:DNA polymerase-3 subunit beta
MKIQVKREHLARGVALVSRVASVRTTLPILANILIKTSEGRIQLTATDLEVGISTWIRGKIEQEGALTVPARLLQDFVTTNTDDQLSLTQDREQLTITSSHHTVTIHGVSDTEFPLIPTVHGAIEFSLPIPDVRALIHQTLFAAALDDTRPVLAGVLFAGSETTLVVAATDSYRLAERRVTLSAAVPAFRRIIPHRSVAELQRILPAGPSQSGTAASIGAVHFSFMENQLQVRMTPPGSESSDRELVSRLIDGNFPDYQQIIPKTPLTTLILNRQALIDAVRLASFFVRDSSNHLKLVSSSEGVTVEAVSAELGRSRSTLTADVTGEPLTIAFNAKFLLDALTVMTGETISVECGTSLQPVLFTDATLPDALFIVMPLRTEK